MSMLRSHARPFGAMPADAMQPFGMPCSGSFLSGCTSLRRSPRHLQPLEPTGTSHNDFASPLPRRPPPRQLVPGALATARWASSYMPDPVIEPTADGTFLGATYRHPAAFGRSAEALKPLMSEHERIAIHQAAANLAGYSLKLPPARSRGASHRATPRGPSSHGAAAYSTSAAPGRVPPLPPGALLPLREHVSASGFSSAPYVSLRHAPLVSPRIA